jgi:hypothetical protein
MNVNEAKLPLSVSSWSNGAWPWPAGRTGNAQRLTQSADPPMSDADGDELARPLISPPLIPRVFPGL